MRVFTFVSFVLCGERLKKKKIGKNIMEVNKSAALVPRTLLKTRGDDLPINIAMAQTLDIFLSLYWPMAVVNMIPLKSAACRCE